MNKVFRKAMNAIEQIENTMKKKHVQKSEGHPASWLLLCLVAMSSLFSPLSASAITKENADSAYAQGQYQQAIKDYEELLKHGVSAELYYNLGNAYYRTEDITRAVLNYERALLLSPGDRDIRFNLQMARSKTIDKITPESEMFFVTWYRSLVNLMSVDAWAGTALFSLALAIVLVLLYLFADSIWLQKIGFFGFIMLLLVFILSNVLAHVQKQELVNRTGAIIMGAAVNVKSTPAKNGTDLFILHEGTKVEITDGAMKDWKRVKVADGKDGWVEAKDLEVI